MAEAVEELGREWESRNYWIVPAIIENHRCATKPAGESIFRLGTAEIVFQQPRLESDIPAVVIDFRSFPNSRHSGDDVCFLDD